MQWDFRSLSPESLHPVTTLFSDRGIPATYRNMNCYSSHTYSLSRRQRGLQQPGGNLYRLMNADQQAQLIGNLVGALKVVPVSSGNTRLSIATRPIRNTAAASPRGSGSTWMR